MLRISFDHLSRRRRDFPHSWQHHTSREMFAYLSSLRPPPRPVNRDGTLFVMVVYERRMYVQVQEQVCTCTYSRPDYTCISLSTCLQLTVTAKSSEAPHQKDDLLSPVVPARPFGRKPNPSLSPHDPCINQQIISARRLTPSPVALSLSLALSCLYLSARHFLLHASASASASAITIFDTMANGDTEFTKQAGKLSNEP